MKKILIFGSTNKQSIGRKFAQWLSKGNIMFLASRSLKNLDLENWHERQCNISNDLAVKNLINKVIPDIALLMADSGTAGKNLYSLSPNDIKKFINIKLVSSVSIVQHILKINPRCKIIWTMGTLQNKPSNLILYSLVNNGIVGFMNQLNFEGYHAYYLMTPLISTNLSKEYLKDKIENKDLVQKVSVLKSPLFSIIHNRKKPGIVYCKKAI